MVFALSNRVARARPVPIVQTSSNDDFRESRRTATLRNVVERLQRVWTMQVETMGDVGALVRSARTARGMTQADLAAQLHMSRDWVIRLEKGHPRLEAQRVLDALRVVGVPLEATVAEGSLTGRKRKPDKRGLDRAADPFAELFGTKEP